MRARTPLALAVSWACGSGAALGSPPIATGVVPGEETAIVIDGGFVLVELGAPSAPPLPVASGDLAIVWGLGHGLDLGLRYRSDLGLIHRLGPELRACLWSNERWHARVRLVPSVLFVGTVRDRFDYAGELATHLAVALAHRWGDGIALSLEVGPSVQWLVFEHIEDVTAVDDVPYLDAVEIALTLEWSNGQMANLHLGLELDVPTTPDDPFTVLGVVPRLVFGGSMRL